ncbi:hypothetical protein H6F42_06250 [Pseudanabaena sp. FACHB-1998]|uniref:site-2 protease family protein n=1 Tax=Pseudanabaena sp. FACHB-1998 TaxID=2692858 RepID=UPI00168172FF|nr:site-2 protease family protein [Pseudanabaena sp. FACHB-1998]MBD2176514.1 hypothetical protein [Pseudanabaena sp. FACHB-1998]
MGFEEIFVFFVVGCAAIYHQRSPRLSPDLSSDRLRTIFLWTLAVAIPCIAIAGITIYKVNFSLTFVMMGLVIGLWIYSNWQNPTPADAQINEQFSNQISCILNPTEEQQLKDCFPQNIYQLKSLECHPHEIYCRGKLRSQNYKYAYETISQNIQKTFDDRFVCTLQESPIENLGTGFGKLSNLQTDQPTTTNYCFYLIPITPFTSSPIRPHHFIGIASVVLTAFTVMVAGANIHRLEDIRLFNLIQGLPYFLGIASIFLGRAIAQNYIAKKYGLPIENLNRPIFLPCFGGFGLIGSLSPKLNFLPRQNSTSSQNLSQQRRILFDFVSLPAIAGLTISLILIILGNWFLIPATPSAIADPLLAQSGLGQNLMPNLQSFNFRFSILATLIHNILQTITNLGRTVTSNEIHSFSPLALAGWSGFALSALQLLPFSFLDGGYLAIAMFGYRQTIQVARIARLVILAIAILAQPWLRIYILLLFLLPMPQPLILNETIELDKKRDLVGIALMAIGLLIILPLPKSLL